MTSALLPLPAGPFLAMLPPWVRVWYAAIQEYPSTNGMKFHAIVLTYATGFFLAAAAIYGGVTDKLVDYHEGVLGLWFGLIAAMGGFGVYQTKVKWDKIEGLAQNGGSAAAGAASATIAADDTATARSARPALTRDDAQLAADVYAQGTRPADVPDVPGEGG